MDFLQTPVNWINNRFFQKQKDESFDNLSLEALNNRIRLVVWFVLLVHMLGVAFFSPTRIPTLYYFVCIPGWVAYFFLLKKCKNDLLKGLPFLVINLGATLALIQKGESFYLRLITISLPTLPVYSVQGFPPYLVVILGLGYYWIQTHYLYYLDVFYEPITSTYRIPAVSLQNVVKGYRVALFLVVLCLTTYQIVVQRLWKNYQKARKNLEEANQKAQCANLQLAKNVEELGHLNTQLKQALQSQDLFVACVSHELRNPLNVMLGSLDLLEPTIKDPSQLQLVKTCRICGDVLLSQINNLLDVAKINADKLEISEFATNMGVFLEKFWAFTRIGLEKKGLLGHLAVDKNLSLWLNIDEHRLHQILNNLVGNAIKFTTEGSVRITLRWIKGESLNSWNSAHEKVKREKSEVSNLPSLDMTAMITSLDISTRNFKSDQTSTDSIDTVEGEGETHKAYSSMVLSRNNVNNNFLNFKLHQPVKDVLEATLPSSTDAEENFLKIDILDTGCGIPREVQENIFEPFVQGDRSVTRKYGGTGLGLYIVRSLINKMGGTIKISSLKDVGTHFQIILPVKATKAITLRSLEKKQSLASGVPNSLGCIERRIYRLDSSHDQDPANTPRRKQSKKVLIVDDDQFNQNLLKEYLKKFNIECDIANNGLEGFQKYQANIDKYAFITMDIQMPTMDGITACKKIRAHEKSINKSKIPIIIITGNCTEDEQREALDNIGTSYFFRKPFRLSDCKLCVEKILAETQ